MKAMPNLILPNVPEIQWLAGCARAHSCSGAVKGEGSNFSARKLGILG